MLIYSNGCSHTAGHGISWLRTWPHFTIRGMLGHNEYQSNPHIMGKKEKNVLYNEGIQGAGNDYIFHQSLETISRLIKNNEKPDYVFIQWSGPNRRQHCLPSGELKNVNLYDNVEYHIKFEPMASLHTLHYMYSLQEFLKTENVNYYFFNYMSLDESIKNLSAYKNIDFSRIIDFGFGNDILTNGILEHIKNKKLSCDDMGHPNEEGNQYIANEILKKL